MKATEPINVKSEAWKELLAMRAEYQRSKMADGNPNGKIAVNCCLGGHIAGYIKV